jgi:proteasome accessory factor B
MPTTDKLTRWIDLLSALLRRRFAVTFDELARDVPAYAHEGPASPTLQRMFERDKDELRRAGVPIETVVGPDGEPSQYRMRAESFYLPYLVLTGSAPRVLDRVAGYRALPSLALPPEEAAMLRRAADRVMALEAAPLVADASRALRKLRYDLPDVIPEPPTAATAGAGDAFATLANAVEQAKAVTFRYFSIGRGAEEARTVHPYGLVYVTGNWYLVAHQPGTDGVRLFRTSRMQGVSANGKAPGTPDFTVPADFDLRAHARSRQAWELGTGDLEMIEVAFRGAGGAVSSAVRLGEACASDDPSVVQRRFHVRRRDTFLRWLLTFAGEAIPIAPPAVVTDWSELVIATRQAHLDAEVLA